MLFQVLLINISKNMMVPRINKNAIMDNDHKMVKCGGQNDILCK